VEVHDLGRVRIDIGSRRLDGSGVRRKVLALLCLLITRPGLAASREEVIENLWPDQDPEDGLNSLNQTAYFLRRVFEPKFREESSPGYLHQDGETIWLDAGLVSAQSLVCRAAVDRLGTDPTAMEALDLLSSYPAPFALNFAYEEWAARYREPLHASVLRVIEDALRRTIEAEDYRTAIALAERAAVLEPESEEFQLTLVGLYRQTGAPAAAAEQYGRYLETMRSLGVEPFPADSITVPTRLG
jgi:DNA-binding SARP family transcriptional activator